jgi:type II secretory pathway component PulF
MNQATFRSDLIATVVHVSTHFFLWLVFIAVMIFYLPSREAMFADLKFKVPEATIYILDLSHWIIEFWFILMPFLILMLLIADAPVYFLLRNGAKRPSASRLWSALMILLPLAALGIAVLAISLPYVKVLEGLSK